MAKLFLAVAALLLVGAVAQTPSRCPAIKVDTQNIPGAWHGYFLSTYSSGDLDTYYQADAHVTVSVEGSGDSAPVTALVNLSNPICTGGCGSTKPLDLPPCVVKYNIVCLTDSDSTVWGWAVDESSKPACTQPSSDWTCTARLTGTKYQDLGHMASFFTRLTWEPDVPGPPLHLMPFGTFMTGCPAENNGQIQGRLIPVTN
uniref:Uncharacterized protein n=1 Tax=Bicosoecida sp. CB-2014 TaxID=1486930 RepID=A0A7S1CFU1_9STRA